MSYGILATSKLIVGHIVSNSIAFEETHAIVAFKSGNLFGKQMLNEQIIARLMSSSITLPVGNLAKNSLEVLVSPKTKLEANFTLAPEYSAAMSTF